MQSLLSSSSGVVAKANLSVKTIAFIYFLFSVFTQMVDWLPRSYAFMEAWCLALFLWAMACKENPEPISMLLVSLVMGVVFDIIHMWLSFGTSYKSLVDDGNVSSGLYYFSVTMAVIAMLLKPVYIILLSSDYGKRGGDLSSLFKTPTGGAMPGFMSQGGGQAYQNLDGQDDRASMLGSGVKDPNSAFVGSQGFTGQQQQMGGGHMGMGGGYGY